MNIGPVLFEDIKTYTDVIILVNLKEWRVLVVKKYCKIEMAKTCIIMSSIQVSCPLATYVTEGKCLVAQY